jgi:hypothetical protein
MPASRVYYGGAASPSDCGPIFLDIRYAYAYNYQAPLRRHFSKSLGVEKAAKLPLNERPNRLDKRMGISYNHFCASGWIRISQGAAEQIMQMTEDITE